MNKLYFVKTPLATKPHVQALFQKGWIIQFLHLLFFTRLLTFQEIDPSLKSYVPPPVLNLKALGHNLRLKENVGKKGAHPHSLVFLGGVLDAEETA